MPQKFQRKSTVKAAIPTASMPDIIFMLLLFFMVSTTMREASGLPVNLPSAKKIEKLPGRRGVATIYVDKAGRISIDDKLVDVKSIANLMYQKMIDPVSPLKVVSLRIDRDVEMGLVTEVHEKLRDAGALNVSYSAKFAGD
ncbi:MAG: biopolymer transporter ExbD [candidate division KSB1 bacterium]|nr:biopolymer transporter ExbD [candidate division KSB1 bacterium]